MSQWTYVAAGLQLRGPLYRIGTDEFNIGKDKILKAFKGKITGSEEDADVFVEKRSGYSLSDGDGTRMDDRYALVIVGELRDRTLDETKGEIIAAYKSIVDKFSIDGRCSSGRLVDYVDGIDLVKVLEEVEDSEWGAWENQK